jgi:hypothetical protein
MCTEAQLLISVVVRGGVIQASEFVPRSCLGTCFLALEVDHLSRRSPSKLFSISRDATELGSRELYQSVLFLKCHDGLEYFLVS